MPSSKEGDECGKIARNGIERSGETAGEFEVARQSEDQDLN